jgi:hypothetical protein
MDRFPRDHPIFTDPERVESKGWDSLKDAYLNMKRSWPTLKKAIVHFQKVKSMLLKLSVCISSLYLVFY